MPYAALKQAVCSPRSTIVLSKLGRYPSLVEHYLSHLLYPLGNPSDEPAVFHSSDRKNIYLWIEPPFETTLPSNLRNLVLTSHLDLVWDPTTTDVVSFPDVPSYSNYVVQCGALKILPERQHPFPLPDYNFLTIDLQSVDDPHDAYLRIRTFCDAWKREWSISWSPVLRARVAEHLKQSRDNIKRFVKTNPPEYEKILFTRLFR